MALNRAFKFVMMSEMTYGVAVLLQQTTLSNTDTGEYEPGKEPATIGDKSVVNRRFLETYPSELSFETWSLEN